MAGSPRLLLIGTSGLVGSHLHRAIAGRSAVATSFRVAVPGTVRLDLTDADATKRVVDEARPDVVIVAAADAFVEGCERDPAATRAINVDAVARLVALAPDALFVAFSSEYVFDGTQGPYDEDDAVAPINEYGRRSGARTSFVAQLVDRLRRRERFRVPADQVITPTPAPDLARAVLELVDRGERGTFHCAGPEVLARTEFARKVALAFDLDEGLLDAVPTDALGLLARRPRNAGLRTDKLRATLGRSLPNADAALAALRRSEPAA
jgi:dTDP-4-dehydrorhamnose reductase